MTTLTIPPDAAAARVDAFAEKVFADLLGAFNTAAVTIGVRLGWYTALAGSRAMTSAELAAATDSDERYAREWLEQQTVAGYLQAHDARTAATERRYTLSPEAAEVLTDRDSLAYMAPFPAFVSSLTSSLDDLVEAYRTGAGFGWEQHGDGARCGQAEANRPLFMQQLAREHLRMLDDVHAALSAGGRVADVGCGYGWSAIAIALAYPDVQVDGFDIDGPSVDMARRHAADAGIADRVRFHHVDAATVDATGYDLVFACEFVHDVPDPVGILTAMRRMASPEGAVIVVDERVGEAFTGEHDPVELMFYGFSLVCCLPDSRMAADSAATGTVMRPPTLRRYAAEAGFDAVEVLPIEHDFFRYYRLRS